MAPWQWGASIAATIICTGLFIWSRIEQHANTVLLKGLTVKHKESSDLLQAVLTEQRVLAANQAAVTSGMQKLAESLVDVLRAALKE